ncbi:MAG TPA: carboxymuconolactone decarboxylase family protein [Pyrinomonadaceae bacterium]|nr:carboxymuconolactone decarboxylase family protein [Pyrinomonadaceae bacterium]
MGEPMNKEELEQLMSRYEELIGFVPPRIQARFRLSSSIDPEHLRMQEAMRAHAMYPPCFDVKTAQLMLFGMLLMTMSEGARFHAVAARRAGASWEELYAVAAMAGLFRGLSAMNLASDILDRIMRDEEPQATGGQR